jgi:hypothetical protein
VTTSSPETGRRFTRRRLPAGSIRRLLPSVGLLVVLAIATLLPTTGGALRLANPDKTRADQLRAVIAGLPPDALVLVGFDPDLGTYAEIRATARAALLDLMAHGARLAFISFTAEGRALAAAELDRLRRQGLGVSIGDLGFTAGAEAGLVRSVTDIVPADVAGPVADSIRTHGGGMDAFNLVLVVSGGDLSARSWIEQVRPRLPSLSLVAIAPTFLEPELVPYLRSGQLRGLIATVQDGVAYSEEVPIGTSAPPNRQIAPLPMLVGMLLALGVLVGSALRRMASPSPRGSA